MTVRPSPSSLPARAASNVVIPGTPVAGGTRNPESLPHHIARHLDSRFRRRIGNDNHERNTSHSFHDITLPGVSFPGRTFRPEPGLPNPPVIPGTPVAGGTGNPESLPHHIARHLDSRFRRRIGNDNHERNTSHSCHDITLPGVSFPGQPPRLEPGIQDSIQNHYAR